MDGVGHGGAVAVTGEALVDAVVLARRLIVRQDERASSNHLLNSETVHHQHLIVLRPLISASARHVDSGVDIQGE